MPYLNWKAARLEQEVTPHSQREFQLRLRLESSQRDELVPALEEIFVQGGSELRVDLPREWIVFWKSRSGESRLLIAHPQPEEWVTTIALETEHGRRLVEDLRTLEPGNDLSLSQLGAVSSLNSMSNVEILISIV